MKDSGFGKSIKLGVMYDEMFNNYGYLTSDYVPSEEEVLQGKTRQMDVNIINHGVDYSKISLYMILAFQQFYNTKYLAMEKRVSDIEIIINKLVDKLAYLTK